MQTDMPEWAPSMVAGLRRTHAIADTFSDKQIFDRMMAIEAGLNTSNEMVRLSAYVDGFKAMSERKGLMAVR
jgi:hypothetical protein